MRNSELPEALLGRRDIIDEVMNSLRGPDWHGSLIMADPGMGKTTVAAAVLELGQGRLRGFHAFASPVLSGEPYGALAPFLAGLPMEHGDSPKAVLKTLAAALRTEANECAVLVIEDAQFLDEHSAALLAQLAVASGTKFIFLCSPFPAAPAELWAMCSDGLLKFLEMTPLSPETMHELCLRVLGQQVFPGTNAMLCRLADGNPLYLLELISHARNSGDLVEVDGVWLLARIPSGSTSRMRDSVGTQLQQLAGTSRDALEHVALAGSLDLETLYQVADRAAVDDLEEARLIVISKVPSRRVCFSSPRMGAVAAQLLPTARSLFLRRRLLAKVDLNRERGESLVRHVGWALEAGLQIPDSVALLAAQQGNEHFLSDVAERAAAAVTSPGLSGGARLETAKAMLWRGDRRRFSLMITEILEQSSDPETVQLAAGVCGHVGLRPGLETAAIAELVVSWREAVHRLERSGAFHGDSERAEHHTGLRLLEIQGMHTQGNYQGTEQELVELQNSAVAGTVNGVVSATLLCEARTATGRAVEALKSSALATQLLAQGDGRLAQLHEFVTRRHLSALWHAGQFDELCRFVNQEAERHSLSLLVYGGTIHLAKGLGDIGQGAMNDGLHKLMQAVAALQVSDPGNDLPLGLAATAYTASVLGRESVAEKYATLYEAAAPGRDVATRLRSRAYLLAARGMFEGNPRPSLRRVADEAAALGMLHVEMEVLRLGIHAGDLGLALRLKAVALRCEGQAAKYAAAYAMAISDRDATALLAFSDEAQGQGRELEAAWSAANAVTLLSRRGDRNRLHNAQRLAKRRLAGLVHGHIPLSERLGSGPQLTRRERKVAALVHGGASNRDIAAAFGLSLRTVEGHLYRIFAKLGISDRTEIANTGLDSWQF
ncbi:LuxR C-terminal-related transcriptional regulator [Arthrobacter sp. H35-D1]|uniref:helix-turn-helix transcriptional regulator n=1 Tax=Arthrobacter sp. H35-D1 TaxID=3046202 RepID=UPI0024BB7D08|nr:LuxR C-terminal-related transcriptional regulator [Arthrobacter sp. H35-D1]MDJ0312303.1 LuxR C-terminal-related transcriptional regulator [Arthrobacter sp. H35-D1]